ncbi:hypothetical protein JTB14_015525 [Gonioctena quinquepunctata]|nr:hypothetical protein JTB14_015525 [Gonioctena quinquepunctata]
MMLALILSVFIFLAICVFGQILIDVSNQFHDFLCHSPWIYWNERNRRSLLIILSNTAKPLKISCFGLTDLNYCFLLQVCIHDLVQFTSLL